jgi:hypothetical protein
MEKICRKSGIGNGKGNDFPVSQRIEQKISD